MKNSITVQCKSKQTGRLKVSDQKEKEEKNFDMLVVKFWIGYASNNGCFHSDSRLPLELQHHSSTLVPWGHHNKDIICGLHDCCHTDHDRGDGWREAWRDVSTRWTLGSRFWAGPWVMASSGPM